MFVLVQFDQFHMYIFYVQYYNDDISVLDSKLCDWVNIQLLRDYSSSGGHIVLITDGIESKDRRPLLKDVLPLLEEEGITADAILFTKEVDQQVVHLPEILGGTAYLETGQSNSTAIVAALMATTAKKQSPSSPDSLVVVGVSGILKSEFAC